MLHACEEPGDRGSDVEDYVYFHAHSNNGNAMCNV